MTIKELEEEIFRLRAELETLERLYAIRTGKPFAGKPYAGLVPIKAMRKLLEKRGPSTREEIIAALVEGGAGTGKEMAPDTVVKMSIERNLRPEVGNLREFQGRIGLAEWPDEKWA